MYGCVFVDASMHQASVYVLWLLPTAVEVAILAESLRRGLWRDFPVFISYVAYEIARTGILFWVRHNYAAYYYTYWTTEAVGCLAAFFVIEEIFHNVFHRHLGLQRLGDVLFRWSLLLLVVASVIVALSAPGVDRSRIVAGTFVIKRTVSIVEAGLLGFLFLFVFACGIPWTHYVTGITAGFAVYGSMELSLLVIRAHYGSRADGVFYWGTMIANNCCVLVWAAYLLFPFRERRKPEQPLDARMLDEWNEVVIELLRK